MATTRFKYVGSFGVISIPNEISNKLGWKDENELIVEQPNDSSDYVIVYKKEKAKGPIHE